MKQQILNLIDERIDALEAAFQKRWAADEPISWLNHLREEQATLRWVRKEIVRVFENSSDKT